MVTLEISVVSLTTTIYYTYPKSILITTPIWTQITWPVVVTLAILAVVLGFFWLLMLRGCAMFMVFGTIGMLAICLIGLTLVRAQFCVWTWVYFWVAWHWYVLSCVSKPVSVSEWLDPLNLSGRCLPWQTIYLMQTVYLMQGQCLAPASNAFFLDCFEPKNQKCMAPASDVFLCWFLRAKYE